MLINKEAFGPARRMLVAECQTGDPNMANTHPTGRAPADAACPLEVDEPLQCAPETFFLVQHALWWDAV